MSSGPIELIEPDGTVVFKGSAKPAPGGGSMPFPPWTEDGHGAVVAQTDGEDATPLSVRGVAGQGSTILEVVQQDSDSYLISLQNAAGGPALQLYLDSSGALHFASGFALSGAQIDLIQSLLMTTEAGRVFSITSASGDPGEQIFKATGGTTNSYWGVTGEGLEFFSGGSEPDDLQLNGQYRIQWYDNTGGAPALRFKQKDAGNTITKGIALGSTGSQDTVGAAGGASALPAAPSKYIKVTDADGNHFVVPAYAVS